MCPRCRLPYVPDSPPESEASAAPAADEPQGPDEGPVRSTVAPNERLALRMPWQQLINLPDEGELVLGRSSPQFHAHPDATAAHQVSRRHARFYRDQQGELYVEDLSSANGTYIDGAAVEGAPSRLGSGQILRLAQDVECTVLRLNEFGEPEGD